MTQTSTFQLPSLRKRGRWRGVQQTARIKHSCGEPSGKSQSVAKKKRVIISRHALGVPTFSKGWAVPDDFLRSRHRFPTLSNLVIGCLLPWLQSVDVKWCPRMTVALLQMLWCNCWHNATNSVISRVCLSFQLPLAVFLQSLPQYFRPTQLAYLLISALVCIQSNTVPVCVCARARQGRPHWTATHLHLSLWKKLSLPWTRE